MYRFFNKSKLSKIAISNISPRRYQWTGPNYARGPLMIAVSAVVGAVGASMFSKYWQINYGIEPVPRHSDDHVKK